MAAILPETIQDLINALSSLPGVGPKSASRLAFYLLRQEMTAVNLADALQALHSSIGYCERCFNITSIDRKLCEICDHEKRDGSMVCVVEDHLDVLAMERAGIYQGVYHVLDGLLSPRGGVGPEDINIAPLLTRVKTEGIREVILATNPSMEGDATSAYIQRLLDPTGVKVTHLARGLPFGSDLEYADQNTLLRALTGRSAGE